MKPNLFTDPRKVISIGRTEHCVRISYSGVTVQFRFLITMSELNEAASRTDLSMVFSDCCNILHANYGALVFYHYANDASGEHTTKTVTFKMDVAKFFKRVKQLLDDGVVTESRPLELCTDSFRFRGEDFPNLGWAAIIRDERFKALSCLKHASRTVSASAMRTLKRLLSIKLVQGFTVYNDGGNSFYFEFRSGERVSNGGIIYHRHADAYSIHT